MLKRIIVLSVLLTLLLAACAPVQQGAAPAAEPTAAPNEEQTDGTGNEYVDSVNRRKGETYDTTAFQKDGPYVMALAAQGPTNSWAALFDEHARAYVEELGPEVVSELLYADANGNADIQVPQIEDLMTQQPDALIVVPMGPALAAPVARAMAEGVPVILCASGVPGDDFVTEVGTNLYDAGAGLAEFVAQELGGAGKIVQMNGIPGVDTAEKMAQGATDVWANYPDIEVLDVQYGNWSTAEAKKIAEQWVATYGVDIQGIWSGGAQMSQGIIEAFLEAGLPVPPIGGGEYGNGFLRLVKDNNIRFAGWQYPNAMVRICIDQAIKALKGEPVARFIDFRDEMPGTGTFGNAELDQFYNPDWSDDVFGPIFLSDEKMKELGYMK
ncbi:MAG: substrate-binding domain-containing protein [Caldilineaceae bacterium]